jgi:hypothetical protein
VTGLADGNVITPRVVSASGTINLDARRRPSWSGSAFRRSCRRLSRCRPADAAGAAQEGLRRHGADRALARRQGRLEPAGRLDAEPAAAGADLGEPDRMPDKAVRPYNAFCQPLYTGDTRCPVTGGAATFGQVAFQQDNPLPMNILAIIDEVLPGDTPSTDWPKKRDQQRAA